MKTLQCFKDFEQEFRCNYFFFTAATEDYQGDDMGGGDFDSG